LSWCTRIDHQDTFVANLHDNIGACTREHVHLTLDRENLDAIDDERWGRRGQRDGSNRLLPGCARACDQCSGREANYRRQFEFVSERISHRAICGSYFARVSACGSFNICLT
jgi:hypothetical protein